MGRLPGKYLVRLSPQHFRTVEHVRQNDSPPLGTLEVPKSVNPWNLIAIISVPNVTFLPGLEIVSATASDWPTALDPTSTFLLQWRIGFPPRLPQVSFSQSSLSFPAEV